MAVYPDFLTETRYGRVDGLKGINCRHDFMPFIEGISSRSYTDKELSRLAVDEAKKHIFETRDRNGNPVTKEFTRYEATQEQRRLERIMRKSRADAAGFKEAGLDEDYTAAKAKWQETRRQYERFNQAMGLNSDLTNRVFIDGLGRI